MRMTALPVERRKFVHLTPEVSEVESAITRLRSNGRLVRFFIYLTAVIITFMMATEASAELQLAGTDSATYVTLVWTAPGDDGAVGMASTYDVRYSTSPINDGNWHLATQVSGEPTPSAPGQLDSVTIYGLTLETTTYYFGVKASDEVPNWSGLSNIIFVCDPPSAPTLVGPSNGLTDLHQPLVLDWNNVNGATQYEVQLDENSNFSSPEIQSTGSNSYYTVTGLDLETTFFWRVRSINGCGSGEWSVVWHFTTESFIVSAQDISASDDTVYASSRPNLSIFNAARDDDNTYRFFVSTDSLFLPATIVAKSDDIAESTDGSASWRVDTRLSDVSDYFWRVSLNSDEYSKTFKFSVEPPKTHVYPSPFRLNEASHVTFTELPENSVLVLTTVSGEKVREWRTDSGEFIQWDGTNEAGRRVSSGVYLWYIADSDIRGKLSMIR